MLPGQWAATLEVGVIGCACRDITVAMVEECVNTEIFGPCMFGMLILLPSHTLTPLAFKCYDGTEKKNQFRGSEIAEAD